jgi:hypothetical protein
LDEKKNIFDELLTFEAWIGPMHFLAINIPKKLQADYSCEHKCFSPNEHLVHIKNPYFRKTFSFS